MIVKAKKKPAHNIPFAAMLADGITISFCTTLANIGLDRILFGFCC